jgi:hypothetical protein
MRGVYCLHLQDKEDFSLDCYDAVLYPSSAVMTNYTSTVGLLYRGNVAPVPAFKPYGGMEIKLHSFLSSVLDGDEW